MHVPYHFNDVATVMAIQKQYCYDETGPHRGNLA